MALRHFRPPWLLSPLLAVLLVLTRAYPTTESDAGIFLSVAGRLLAGDRLYRDVFDNKDPLFYLAQSVALWAGGWRGPFLLDIVWITVASVGAHLLLLEVTGDVYVARYAQVAYPVLITGLHYNAGYSETPGLSLLPLFAYVAYRRRGVLAGLLCAGILLARASLLPVVVLVALVSVMSYPATDGLSPRRWLAFLGGTATGIALAFLVLAMRGELGAYLAMLHENMRYASYTLRVEHWPPGPRGHLRIALNNTPQSIRRLTIGAVAFGIGVLAGNDAARRRALKSPLLLLGVAASVGTLLTLATTTLWDHHVEVLAFPLLCGTALAVDWARTAARSFGRRVMRDLVVGAIAAACLLVAVFLRLPSTSNFSRWFDAPRTAVSDALRQAAGSLHSRASYFHLGENDETGQGAFLGESYRLACPRFHQYPWTSPTALRTTSSCMRRERPRFIAVTPSFRIDASVRATPPPAAWRNFILAGRSYLARHCEEAVAKPTVRVYRCR